MSKDQFVVDEAVKNFSGSAKSVSQILSDTVRQLNVMCSPFLQQLKEISEAIAPHVETLVNYFTISEAYRAVGWLPYRLSPFHYVEECGDDTALLDERLANYYKTNWDEIRKDMESRLSKYHIDDEARETFLEALNAHGAGYYRSTCRVLLPEIERVFRVQFFNSKTGKISHEIMKKLTKDKYLENFIMDNPFGLELFGVLVSHLYEQINEGNKEQFEKIPIPNRHAAIHGLIVYSSMKNSFNTIVMADYIFQIVTQAMSSSKAVK